MVTRGRPELRPSHLLVVAAGGAAGTGLRYALERAFGTPAPAWPWATFGINVAGSLAFGVLYAALALAPTRHTRLVRLGVGTGVIGGFTTYSTFVMEADGLMEAGHAWLGAGYAAASIAAGIACAWLGARVARALFADPMRGPRGAPGAA